MCRRALSEPRLWELDKRVRLAALLASRLISWRVAAAMSTANGAANPSPSGRPERTRTTPSRYESPAAATPSGAALLARATSAQGTTPRGAAPKAAAARAGAAAAAKPPTAKPPPANSQFKPVVHSAPLPPRALDAALAAAPLALPPLRRATRSPPKAAAADDAFAPEQTEHALLRAEQEHTLLQKAAYETAKAERARFVWQPKLQKVAIGLVRRADQEGCQPFPASADRRARCPGGDGRPRAVRRHDHVARGACACTNEKTRSWRARSRTGGTQKPWRSRPSAAAMPAGST